jgi:uncharacterized protein
MFDFKIDNWNAYYETVEDIIESDEVLSMRDIPHHIGMTCYEHSVFVSYISFRIARKLGLDYISAARGGLLHDLYLYSKLERNLFGYSHNFIHPKIALDNARRLCNLSDKEENIILSHMWPLSRVFPKSREAVVVSAADKYCATAEAMRIWHRMKIREQLAPV